MHKSPFHALIAFVECERISFEHEQELGRQQRALEQLVQQKNHEQGQLDSIKTLAQSLQKKMNALELEGRALREREKEVRRKLDLVKSEKEFFALKKELDELQVKQEETENSFLLAMQQLEATTAQHEKAVTDAAPWFEKQDALLAGQQEKVDALQAKVTDLKTTCIQRHEEVPAAMLEPYESLKKTMRNPYVPLSGNHCSACSTEVPLKDMGSLRKNILVPCKTCYRMLYMPS